MATISFNLSSDMYSSSVWYGSVSSYDSSHITLVNGGLTSTYYGYFTYNAYGWTGGTVTSYQQYYNGTLDYSVSGTSLDAVTLDNYLNAGNTVGLQQYALSGADTLYGSASADKLRGWSGNDVIYGNGGNDTLEGGTGNDVLDGGTGVNTAKFSDTATSYTLTKTATGYTVKDNASTDGTDTLSNIQRLQFSDQTLALDVSGNAGQAYRLYQAAFNRTPDNGGLKYWIGVIDGGTNLQTVASAFEASAEFKSLYGASPSYDQLISAMYSNVLHRAPDQGGHDYWLSQLNAGTVTRDSLLVNFSESAENQANVIGVIQNGIHLY